MAGVSNTTRKGAAASAGVAGGLALAGLLLPEVASTLRPTAAGTALVAIALALVTTAGQRWIERRRQRSELVNAVRAWPPERLRVADPATLGVYPPRGDDGEPGAYRPRAEDADLRKALRDSKFVVVLGPARAGKSRAASEAAREVLADVPAIVPLNADALRWFADAGIPLNLPEARMCLWLDGLDRFVAALDPLALQTLRAQADDVRIVATIRSDEWEKLLGGTGQESEAARAVAGTAQVIELGPLPSGKSEPVSRDADAWLAPVRPLAPPWRDGWFLALGGVLLLTIFVAVTGLAGDLVEPKPIDEQMDQIKADLRGQGAGRRHVAIDERVRLHATEADSWLLVMQDGRNHDEYYARAAKGRPPPARSDEVRLYDVKDGRLRLKLHFRAAGSGKTAGAWRVLGAGPPTAADYDQDGSDEIIAGLAITGQATSAFVPFAIDWDGGRYDLVSLTPERPRLSREGLERAAVRFRRQAYKEPRTFRNATGGRRFRRLEVTGYRVQTFALVDKPRRQLLTGYFAELPKDVTQPKVLEVHANQFRSGGSPQIKPCTRTYYACRAPERDQEITVPADRTLDGALVEAWETIGEKWITPIRVQEREG